MIAPSRGKQGRRLIEMLRRWTALPAWILFTALLQPIPGKADDIGEIAVIQADPTIVEPGNPFPFVGKTLRFRPTDAGFMIESGALEAEADKGDTTAAFRADPAEVNLSFEFPYFGKRYRKLYAYLYGIVAFEKPQQVLARPSPQALAGQPPLIAALWSPAARHPPGAGAIDGIYVNAKLPDRVILTWYRVMPQRVESVLNSYQVVLSKDGSIQVSYREIEYPEGLVALLAGDAASPPISISLQNAGPVASSGGFYEQFRLPRSIPQKLTQSFYRDHGDVFDALAVFETFQLSHLSFFSSFPVKYRDQRADGRLVDRSHTFGSRGRLESYLELNQLSYYPRNTASAMLTRAYGYRTVQQIIQEQGSSGATTPVPRNLRIAFVLLVAPGKPPREEELAQLDAIRTNWEMDFASYSLGCATMDTRLTAGLGAEPRPGAASTYPRGPVTLPAPQGETPVAGTPSGGEQRLPEGSHAQAPQQQPYSPPGQQQSPGAHAPDGVATGDVPGQTQITSPNSGASQQGQTPGSLAEQLKSALGERVARLLAKGLDVGFGELDKKLDNWAGTRQEWQGGGPSQPGGISGGSQPPPSEAPQTYPAEGQAPSEAAKLTRSTTGQPPGGTEAEASPRGATQPSRAMTGQPSSASVQPPPPAIVDSQLRSDLSVSASDIHFSPTSPRAGEPLNIVATVHNTGRAAATGARIHCAAWMDGRQAGGAAFVVNIQAGGAYTVHWSIKTPVGNRLILGVSASAAQEIELRNNKASVAVVEGK